MDTPELKKEETNMEETQSAAGISAQTSEIEQITKRIEYPVLTEMTFEEVIPSDEKEDTQDLPLPSQNVETENIIEEVLTDVNEEISVHSAEIEQLTKRIEYPNLTAQPHEEDNQVFPLPSQMDTENEKQEIIEIADEANSNSKINIANLTKEELVEKLQERVSQNIRLSRTEKEAIIHNFNNQIHLENEILRKKFIDDGGVAEDFQPQKSELENTFRNLLWQLKELRHEHAAQNERNKEQNLLEKQHIIEQMKMLVEQNSNVDKAVREFRELQQKWKTIGSVPSSHANSLWRDYSQCQEAFWDLVKINNELREYDFRKNLDAKNALIDAAQKLENEKDIVSAFKKLQKLHKEWRETGPVAREIRQEIWQRFKDASSAVNKRHVEHFEKLRKNEAENTALKYELINKISNLDASNLNTFKQWEDASNQISELQKQWREIGFAPRKLNQKLFDKYRKASDDFFSAKSTFFKEKRSELAANVEKKTLLCKRAEELKDSTDWVNTTAMFSDLQKEWRTVGTVPRKSADSLWERFSNARKYFFEKKKVALASQSSEEKANLTKKRNIISRIKSLEITNQSAALKTLKELIVEWNSVGFVPYREKTRIYREYRTSIDAKFDMLNIDENARRLDNFRNNVANLSSRGGSSSLSEEHQKLIRAYERLKQELNTYENNLGFFTSSSKNGGGLIEQMNKKTENLRNECKLLEEKIKLIAREIK